MPHKRCDQCKKRLSNKCEKTFCSDKCEFIFANSPVVFCKNCNVELGKSSITKKKFCCNKCANEYQKRTNQVQRTCINCNKTFTVQKSSHRYKLCSAECDLQYAASKKRNNKRISSLSKNNLKKYGVEFTLSLAEVIQKTKKTKHLKYSNENYRNDEKRNQTMMERYGTTSILKVKDFSDKAIQTKLGRYKTLNFNDKANKTKLEKYGTLNFSAGANETKLKKYGTLNFSEKSKKTIIDKYGSFSKLLMERAYDRLKDKYKNIVDFLFDKEDYSGTQKYKHYSFKCKKCLIIFDDYITNGCYPKCPKCFPYIPSHQEIELMDFIKSIFNGEIVKNDREILPSGKELDIYIPSKNIAIEYNGLYWHSELNGKDRNYHRSKTIECESLGIRLIHVFEDEWLNKKVIVQSKLRHLLNLNAADKIYARNCVIKEVNYDVCSTFLDEYHIQGADKSSIRIGLYNNDKLVAIMTFGHNRIALGNKNLLGEYEMYRFCSADKPVVGAGGKLLSYFIRTYNPLKITSYADRRYSSDHAFYSKLGFDLVGKTAPNYWYFNKTMKRFHRYSFRKSELQKKLQTFDPNLSEWENLQLNGYDRIWDCGNLKYVWIDPN